jgi:pimeloyl-ACP methyl ester carboxylesterase
MTTTYVLVPGFWIGAWSWRRVADALEPRGHRVHAVDLTEMGDRATEATPEVDLETHVLDVVGLLEDLNLCRWRS